MALKDPKVDTVYLLSDGEPNVGKYQTTYAILKQVARLNRTARVQINTIAFGPDAKVDFLKTLALSNWGMFVNKCGSRVR